MCVCVCMCVYIWIQDLGICPPSYSFQGRHHTPHTPHTPQIQTTHARSRPYSTNLSRSSTPSQLYPQTPKVNQSKVKLSPLNLPPPPPASYPYPPRLPQYTQNIPNPRHHPPLTTYHTENTTYTTTNNHNHNLSPKATTYYPVHLPIPYHPPRLPHSQPTRTHVHRRRASHASSQLTSYPARPHILSIHLSPRVSRKGR
jgi:hypothetical protein